MEEALLAGTLLPEGAGQQLSPTTAPPSPSGSRSRSSSVYRPQLRPSICMAFGIFAPARHASHCFKVSHPLQSVWPKCQCRPLVYNKTFCMQYVQSYVSITSETQRCRRQLQHCYADTLPVAFEHVMLQHGLYDLLTHAC